MPRPATPTDIKSNVDHIIENIEDRDHSASQHGTDVGWQHLMNRMAGAEENNPTSRPLAYSKGVTEEAQDLIVRTVFEKHQDALILASQLAFDNQMAHISDSRHNDDHQRFSVDLDMDTWDEENNAPYEIHGEGIVKDPETGHIRPMASSMFTTVIHANSRYQTQRAIEQNPQLNLPQFTLITTYCDLISQLEENKESPLIAAENETIKPNIDLMRLVEQIPRRFVTNEHRASMLCATDPSFESKIHYQANRDKDDRIDRQVIAVEINDKSQLLVRFKSNEKNPELIIAPISQMSGEDPVFLHNMRELHATLAAEAEPTAIKDIHTLFARLEETEGISRSYARTMGVGKHASTARKTLAAEAARDAALKELDNAAQALHASSRTQPQNDHITR